MTGAAIFGSVIAVASTANVGWILRTGRVVMRSPDPPIYRAEEPDRFWFHVALYASAAASGFLLLLLG
jgi:hypothetical protein